MAPLLIGLAVTFASAMAMALGARHAVSVVDQGADDLARWIDVPLGSEQQAGHVGARATAPGATPRSTTRIPSGIPSYSKSRPTARRLQEPRRVAPGGTTQTAKTPAARSAAKNARSTTNEARTELSSAMPIRLPVARLNAPRCDGVSAYIISAFSKSKNSVATLSTDPKHRGRQRRVGQKFGDYRVLRIGYNARRMSSAVWLADGSEVCQVLLRDDHPVRERIQNQGVKKRRAHQARIAKQRQAELRKLQKQELRKKNLRKRKVKKRKTRKRRLKKRRR